MNLAWHGDTQIKTPQGIPLTSHGPALVVGNNVLYMLYVGKGGTNLWMSSTTAAKFPNWQTNAQIVIPGHATPLSSFRPAAAFFNGNIHMVYVGAGGFNLWWSWFDGNAWHGNIQLPWSGGNPQPTLAVDNGKLHLVWHDHQAAVYGHQNNQNILIEPEHNYIRYASLDAREPLQVSSWQGPALLGDGGQLPSLASYNGSLRLALTTAVAHGAPPRQINGLLMGKWQGGVWNGWSEFKITGSAPRSVGGIATAVFGNELYLVYPGEGGANIWYAYVDMLGVDAGNIQVKVPGSTPKTSAPLGLTSFNGKLCLAYKGESSNNSWFSYAD